MIDRAEDDEENETKAGCSGHVCVEITLRSAYVRDFDVVLASDCVGAWNDDDMRLTQAVEES